MKRGKNLKLKSAIVGSGKSFEEVARLAEMPMTTFSRKVNGHSDFTETEIENICKILEKSPTDIFFINIVTESITMSA